ncbi:hypothetical protein THIOM_004912 [Candidatus Thiomargarita nelsonii]|uniref:Uncharacterized protein n=1 Tax=Candidatus Thiomargarita nelsonii TaxID=1003181 RepID=A0A176RUN2_9GAMM|nr:hypothetical protein THIOM_004912 [Candidatus Thiomargarita nelsonii]
MFLIVGEDMWFLLRSILIVGILMGYQNLAFAHDAHVTQEHLSQIIKEVRNNYQIPAIAVTVMNSDKILLQEIQGTRVIDKNKPATLDDYFRGVPT